MAGGADSLTVVITGAASGIGAGAARRFAREGHKVVIADLDGARAEALAAELASQGHQVMACEVDVTSQSSTEALMTRARDWTGEVDAVVANAGIMVEGDALSISLEDWRRVMEVNATGAFLTARAALPHLIESAGALVFTASTVGLAGMKGVAAYSASKGAVVALTRQLAADYAGQGVRVNAVAPGAVRTPLSESQFRARADSDEAFETMLSAVIDRYPLKRWGTTDDIAELMLFLATGRAGWITGQIIPVDGGLLEIR